MPNPLESKKTRPLKSTYDENIVNDSTVNLSGVRIILHTHYFGFQRNSKTSLTAFLPNKIKTT